MVHPSRIGRYCDASGVRLCFIRLYLNNTLIAYRISRLMVEKLPLVVWPKMLAQDKAQRRGYLTVEKLPRLLRLCPTTQTPIEAILGFEWIAAYDCVLLTMRIEATLALQCQRCLAPMKWDARLQNQLCIVNSDTHARRLPRSADYYVCASDKMSVVDLIEDELLLVIPQNPIHGDENECNPEFIGYLNHYRHRSKTNENPFKVLKETLETTE